MGVWVARRVPKREQRVSRWAKNRGPNTFPPSVCTEATDSQRP